MSEITSTPTPETEQPNTETKELTDEEIEQLTGQPIPPVWLINDKKINEPMFCAEFLENHALRCINGHFIGYDGVVEDSIIETEIYKLIKPFINNNISRKIKQLLGALKLEAHSEEFVPDSSIIHLQNGTYHLADGFTEDKTFCFNRLNVAYNTSAPEPAVFRKFLGDLFYEDDIPTVQEWLGYCLTSSTKSQKMLTVIGNGGEGKSRIGVLLKDMFGDGMISGGLHHLENNRFAQANLENRYLFLDDDLKIEALGQTNKLKQIVTNEGKLMIERKGIQAYPALIYSKIMAFGNGTLTALNDMTDAFFRRQIIITTRPKPEGRIDDPFIAEKMIAEKEGILLWAIEGLKRLMANSYNFSLSERTKENLRKSMEDNCNIIPFLKSEDWIAFVPDAFTSTRELYDHYDYWCSENCEKPLPPRNFSGYLNQNVEKFKIRPDTHGINSNGRRARGYRGIMKKVS